MALTLRGNGQITSDNYTIDSDGDVTAVNAAVSGTLGVTGDATFDTSTLKVDATNNRVGIGTATPSKVLDITESASADTGQVKLTYAGGDGNRSGFILNNTHTGGREYGIYAGNNSTGGGLGNSLGISDNTASTAYRLLISSDGYVTNPSQPAFNAKNTNSVAISGTVTLTFNEVRSNASNSYNSSNGIFTAPIAGQYIFTHKALYYAFDNTEYLDLYTYVNSSIRNRYEQTGNSGAHTQVNYAEVVYLNANDTFKIVCSNRNIGSYSMYAQENHFSGRLLG